MIIVFCSRPVGSQVLGPRECLYALRRPITCDGRPDPGRILWWSNSRPCPKVLYRIRVAVLYEEVFPLPLCVHVSAPLHLEPPCGCVKILYLLNDRLVRHFEFQLKKFNKHTQITLPTSQTVPPKKCRQKHLKFSNMIYRNP